MKFFFDSQIFQTKAYDRGLGKYSLSLLRSLLQNKDFVQKYEVSLIFNKNLNFNKQRLTEINQWSLPVLKLDLPVDITVSRDTKYSLAKSVLTKTIKKEIGEEEAVFFVPSPFFVDYAAVYPDIPNVIKVCIVYDIIPYLIWRKQKIFNDDIYLKHFQLLIESNRLFTISDTVKKNLCVHFGLDKSTVLHAGLPTELRTSITNARSKKYILFPSAPIMHKNTINAVRAFQKFNTKHRNKYELLITSTFDKESRTLIKEIGKSVIFTGNVSNETIEGLYSGCDMVLLASLVEGLGLPILEGVAYKKPVACSNIDVFTEISDEAFYFFDPLNINDIAKAMEEAVEKKMWSEKRRTYPNILKRYDWHNCAEEVTKVLDQTKAKDVFSKPKLLIKCPESDILNPAGRFIEKFYAPIRQEYDTTVHFLKKRGEKVPSYVKYLSQGKNGYEQVVMTVDLLSKNVDKGEIGVYLAGKTSRLPKFNLLRKKTEVIKLNYIRETDKNTGFINYRYLYEGIQISPKNLLGVIKDAWPVDSKPLQ